MKTSRLLGFAFWAISFGLLGCGEIENPIEPTPDPKPEEVKSEITIDADDLGIAAKTFFNVE